MKNFSAQKLYDNADERPRLLRCDESSLNDDLLPEGQELNVTCISIIGPTNSANAKFSENLQQHSCSINLCEYIRFPFF